MHGFDVSRHFGTKPKINITKRNRKLFLFEKEIYIFLKKFTVTIL